MAQMLGNDKCNALPAFHELTVRDITSSYTERRNRTVWIIQSTSWTKKSTLCRHQDALLSAFNTANDNVGKARQTWFTQNSREIEDILPTKDALS